jgi:tetratricopeptide (TPR) repeat protein
VVANIKSRDEILALLFCFVTLYFSIEFIERRKIKYAIISGLVFFLALLSKENSVTFLAIQPMVFYFFTSTKKETNFIAALPLIASTLIFLLIRQSVIGNASSPLEKDLMNNPFVEMTLTQKYSTILYTLGLYVKLLIFPHPLTSDYYPYHIPIINPGDWRAILPLLLYIAMAVYIILKIKNKSIVAFSLFYFLVTISIASNILFPIGTFMNERFLFMPSLAFCLLLVAGIVWLQNHVAISMLAKKTIVFVLMLTTLTLYAYKTINRNADWYDSYTLFTTDVKVSANSAKGNEVAGEYIMNKASQVQDTIEKKRMLKQSIDYQRKAISIYPKQIIALINLAASHYQYNKNYDTVLIVYKTILNYLPNNEQIYTFFNSVMGQYDNIDHKIRLYTDLYQINTERLDVNINLGILYLGGKQDANSALPFLIKAVSLKPDDYDANKYLGTAYAYLSRWKEAKDKLEMAESIKPGDAEMNGNLAIVYQNLGETENAKIAKARASAGTKR